MSQDSFFNDEIQYLKDKSKDFSTAFPQASLFLSESSGDPDVNRTLESFAYLSSLLNAKLAKEYPQLTSSLMNMLWPNAVQITPSMTIMEFDNQTRSSIFVPRGAMMKNELSKNVPVACQFRVARNTWISPFSVSRCLVKTTSTESEIEIYFKAPKGVPLNSLDLNNLSLFCGDDPYVSYQLYMWLSNYLSSASFLINGSEISLPSFKFEPLGFEEDESILDYPKNTFSGYKLLQEYFCYPEGYLFLKLSGIPDYFDGIETETFSLKMRFSRPLSSTVKVRDNAFKTNCVPAINLFYHDCEPIMLNGYKTEYPLVINYQNANFYELFSVESVDGYINQTHVGHGKAERKYSLFESFQHQLDKDRGMNSLYYYINRSQKTRSDKIHYAVSFIRNDEIQCYEKPETVSVRALCTNNNEAQKLNVGDICVMECDIDPNLTFRNITYPSMSMRPKFDNSQNWTTISTMSLNYLSLLNKDSLGQLLHNFNFSALYSKRSAQTLSKILDSITTFETKMRQITYNDYPLIGHESTIHISPSAFNNEGELFLFGAVIANFYARYASVNSFHYLNLLNTSTQEIYQWLLRKS